MKTGLFKRFRACAILIALASLTELPARDAAYLPLIGPPPLRFEKVADGPKKITWIPPALVQRAVTVETNLPSVTSIMPVNNVVTPPPAIGPANAPVSASPGNLATKSTEQAKSANDLLEVTPEMLVDYFKPNNNATNAANVRVLVPVNFTPPASVSIPSSQAIYRSP